MRITYQSGDLMAKRIRVFLNGREVGTGELSADEKTVENIRFNPHIDPKDREKLLHDRELKVQERRQNG
jgi:hypothetical protein